MTSEYLVAPGGRAADDGEGPYYCRVVDIPQGVLVMLCREDRPKGQRKIAEGVFDAPMWRVLNAVREELHTLNRDYLGWPR